MRKVYWVVLVVFLCSLEVGAAQRFVINALGKKGVSWENTGEIVVFDFTFFDKKGNKVKPAGDSSFFKVDAIHEGLWLRNWHPEVSGPLPSGIGYRIIQVSTDGKLMKGKVGPSLDKNANKPGSADDTLSKAMAAYKIGNFTESLPLFMKVYNTFPEDRGAPFSVFMASQSLCALRKFNESAALYSAMIKKYPSSKLVPAAFFRIACVSIGFLDKEQEGRAIFDLIMKKYPRNKYAGEALFNVSALNFIQGKTAVAIAGFNELIRRFPAHYRAKVAKNTLKQLASQLAGK